jgi:hypothetical protein
MLVRVDFVARYFRPFASCAASTQAGRRELRLDFNMKKMRYGCNPPDRDGRTTASCRRRIQGETDDAPEGADFFASSSKSNAVGEVTAATRTIRAATGR